MKIINICLTGPFTEGYSYQENLMNKYFSLMGHDCTIIANNKSFKEGKIVTVEAESKVIDYNIRLIRLNHRKDIPKKIAERFRVYEGLYKKLDEIKPNLIFVHGLQFLDIKYIANYKKNNPNVKIIVDNHADFSNSATNFISKNILHKIIWKYCAKKIECYTDKFYGVLPSRVDFLVDVYGIDDEKVELLVMGADDEKIDSIDNKKIKNKFNIQDKDFVIVTGGKIDSAKMQTILLMKAVKKIQKNIKLIIFGSIADELKEEVKGLIDNEKIYYAGWLNYDQSYEYFSIADLAVFPGRHSVFWEQVAGMGIPMLVKHWSGTDHINVNGNCRFIYEDSVDSIRNEINTIIENKEIYKNMNFAAKNNAKTKFLYSNISKKCIEDLAY
ncbi:glycosyltransferase family 4 protein [Paraclostridium sordellii]|uniref:glycosyltransferase family 4 protein n=1 Tax=Paraclostridium sordellii TaxID=1505 RepID=UPI00054336A2|nr:glycosyltransferase family 4 protein [Paeniclostridium sordellii]MCH1967188.1 glycosyltransferase family 4 protein [Paeniclostridium sordellii]CEK32858.1 LPS glycosyltransferase,lipopolysaccharide 1,2-N-acetylglucosaminetransferase,glycosyltransferase, GG-Bacteroidales peptide system,Glycosyl transferases group 1 [[Clostridium] sordellii] [Paeniclostridium sordellii]